MKNKLLSIAIASALTAIWSTSVLAADPNNNMDVTQKNSSGTVDASQGATDQTTTSSSINIHQEGAVTGSNVKVEQFGATGAEANVKQYQTESEAISTVTIKQIEQNNIANIVQGTSGFNADGTPIETVENSGNTLNINTQTGSGNKVVGYADTDVTNDVTSYATQLGSTNTAVLNQDGNTNIIGFNQNGTGNTADLTQNEDSSDSTMNVSQEGDGNTTTASQGAVSSSEININILGDENNSGGEEVDSGKVEQLSADSTITVDIDGNANKTVISQTANALGSDMTLTQTGNTNTATMTQNGADNTMDLLQDSDTNIATLTQNGANDTMNVNQYGGSTATLTQN